MRSFLIIAFALAGFASDSLAGSWSARTISTQDLFDVSFPTAERGWAVGANGTILASADGGLTWSLQNSGTSSELHAVDFVDTDHGWALGANDTVLYTTNGGATWTSTTTGAAANLQDVDFVDQNNGWAVGTSLFAVNTIVRTTDGGKTWVAQTAPAGAGLYSVSFADGQRGFAGGLLDAAYRTEDGGQTWVPMTVAAGNDAFYAVRRINSSEGLIAGFAGIIYRTQDGGLTWSVAASLGKEIRGLVPAGTSAFAAGIEGLLARSEDRGASWQTESAGIIDNLKGVTAPSPGSAFGVGESGVLVEFKASPPIPLPLDVGPLPESCQGCGILWKRSATNFLVAAATGNVIGDSTPEIAVAGPSGLRILRPFVATEQATVSALPFQTRFQHVSLAELDGDSGKEIVGATAFSGPSQSGVVAADAETTSVKWSRRISGGSITLRVADFNGDAVDDVVSIGEGQTLSWLDGRDGSDLYGIRALNANPTDLETADFNGDGIPDVVVTLSDGKVLALNGANGSVLWSYQSQGNTNPFTGGLRSVAPGDLNGDGIADVIVAGQGSSASATPGNGDCTQAVPLGTNGALIAALDGASGTLLWDYMEPGFGRFTAVSLGDFNLDGTPDVVGHASRSGASHLVALDGRGKRVGGVSTQPDAQTLWQFVTTRTTDSTQYAALSPEAIAVGDGNGDGVPDAYVALYNGSVIAVSGSVPAPAATFCAASATQLWEAQRNGTNFHISFLQVDSRRLVLILGSDLAVLRNAATGAVEWAYDSGILPSLAIGDLDGDGRPEIGVGSTSGRIYALDGSGSPLAPSDNFLPASVVGVAVANTDGNSARELVGVTSDGTVRAVNPRTGQQVWEQQIGHATTSIAAGAGLVVVGAKDGTVAALDVIDGMPKWERPGSARINVIVFVPERNLFVVGDENGDVRFFDTFGQPQGPFPTGTDRLGGVFALALLDVDKDGTFEFALGAGRSFIALRSDGSELWRYDVPTTGTLVFATYVAAVDLDGDGAQDLVGETTAGKAYAFTGATGGFLWSVDLGGNPGGVGAMDVDGDGKQEALLGSESPGFPFGQGFLKAVRANGAVLASCTLSKSAHAIVTGDFDGDGAVEAAVGMTEGDIYFVEGVIPPTPVPLTSIVSRKIHGSAGPFNIPLPLTGSPGIECRSGGANRDYTMIFKFATELTSVDGASASATKEGGGNQPVTATGSINPADRKEYIVNLAGVPNAQVLTVSLANVNDSASNSSASVSASMGVLLGDTTGDGVVDSGDITQVRRQSGQVTAEANKRIDLSVEGVINSGDITLVRRQSGTALPTP